VSCYLEYKPSLTGRISDLYVGTYQPKFFQTRQAIISQIKQGLENAPWNNLEVKSKLANIFVRQHARLRGEVFTIPVFAFVTGGIRNHFESHPQEAVQISGEVNSLLEEVLGREAHFSKILGLETDSFLMPQRLEGQMELVG